MAVIMQASYSHRLLCFSCIVWYVKPAAAPTPGQITGQVHPHQCSSTVAGCGRGD